MSKKFKNSMKACHLIAMTVLLASCSEQSNRVIPDNSATNFDTLFASSTPQVGQQLISDEIQATRLTRYQKLNIDCNFQKIRTTKTVVRVEGDDIFVETVKGFTDLDEKSDDICKEEISISKKLIKKSLKQERSVVSRLQDENKEGCKRECEQNIELENNEAVFVYSGIYEYGKLEAKVEGRIAPNTESPWLSPFLSSNQKVTIVGSHDSIISKQLFTKNFENDVDTSEIDFEEYELAIYKNEAIDRTERFLNENANQIFKTQVDGLEYEITFKKGLTNKYIQTREIELLDGTRCFIKKESPIELIEEKSNFSRAKRLAEDTITMTLNGEESSYDVNRINQEDLVKCLNTPLMTDDPTIIHKFLKLHENGDIELDIKRQSAGKIYSRQ
ncbi:hypothetical protein [Bacteriovorax sp. DB6_IX]|uniref:hypothetical protein n=1 Tax=Bacteriovorax sp. DB6_IX TaxID=1353530 RepID=UPI00042286F4|nr:hypothetical protein [Bacteriovorax sp. DB6_IX]